jgi:hypothetical protein
MSEKIIIDTIDRRLGNGGDDLKGCYFKLQPNGGFNFHSKDDHVQIRNVCVGSTFSFSLDHLPDLTWTLTIRSAALDRVDGSWSDGKDTAGEGTYQAQAGGTVEGEESAAYAAR